MKASSIKSFASIAEHRRYKGSYDQQLKRRLVRGCRPRPHPIRSARLIVNFRDQCFAIGFSGHENAELGVPARTLNLPIAVID
jgi:hypothetical protein